MIETLEDIVEQIANEVGVYGACTNECHAHTCRSCYVSTLRNRIINAVEVEQRLNRPYSGRSNHEVVAP